MMNKARILFLGKRDDAHCLRALGYCKQIFAEVDSYVGQWREPIPDTVRSWTGDYIFSYLSRWVVPASVLAKAKIAAINFHAAPPEYPGFGPINFALYEGAATYGVTCHHMAARVDTGDIIAIKRFPIHSTDDVASLLLRTYDFQLVLFYEIMERIARDEKLAPIGERWTRVPFTRKQFEELNRLDPSMPEKEIVRRVRAMTFQSFRPQLRLGDVVFEPR
jgi:methionyl-tRNA formyltransferase